MDILSFDNVNTPDDVTKVIDELGAHVVWMSVDEEIKNVMLEALQEALKKIEKAL